MSQPELLHSERPPRHQPTPTGRRICREAGRSIGGHDHRRLFLRLLCAGDRWLIFLLTREEKCAVSRNFGATYALAGNVIAAKCYVPFVYRFDLEGTVTYVTVGVVLAALITFP